MTLGFPCWMTPPTTLQTFCDFFEVVVYVFLFTVLGCANQKIDIFKFTCKLLLCVGVGLIKKTLEWQQISPIPSSETTVKYVKIELFMVAVFCNLVYLD